MQVSVEATGSIQRKMTVTLPIDNIDKEVDKRLKSMRGKVRLDGFRPGKVPLSIVKQRYGLGIFQEVAGDVVQNSFFEAANQENLRVAGYPSFEPKVMEMGKDIEYDAHFEVYPEIVLADLSDVNIAKPDTEINDADIDKVIENIRTQQKEWETVERESAEGDKVVIDFEGSVDGELFEGGDASNYEVEIGASRMLKDFEEALHGMKAGDEKTADVAFPEDYQAENLKGKTAQFRLVMKEVKQSKLAEIDEDFIKRFGVESGTMDDFRNEVKGNMDREMKGAINMQVKTQVMDSLHERHELDVPAALVNDEIGHMRQEMQQNTGIDASQMPEDLFKPQAERRVKLGLVVGEIIRQNEIQKDDQRIQDKLQELAASYEDPKALIEYYTSNEEAMQTINAAVMEDMVVEWVLNTVNVTVENKSFDELMEQAKQQQAAA